MGGPFWEASLFNGPKRGYPPKKIQFFFQKIISQRIDRNCQEVLSTSELRFSHDKHLKICQVNMPPPLMSNRVKVVIILGFMFISEVTLLRGMLHQKMG